MRPYERLSDNEFEDLVGDLLGTQEDRVYERFRRGPDMGIDLRHVDGDELDVVQCKHYLRSTMSHLRAAARREADRLQRLDPAPTRYRFATSHALTPGNKDELAELLAPWIAGPEDVLGANDVEALLDIHGPVERRHVKLWLTGGTALAALLSAEIYNRSQNLLGRIDEVLPRYVRTDAFLRAHEKLREEHVCLISGRPGIGKTTLAQMLVADAAKEGFEPIEISSDVDEAWRVLDPNEKQIFYYDDFLGTTTLGELSKNEDQRLVRFIAAVAGNPSSLFVLTTREYIYRQARNLYESFERSDIDGTKFLLTLADYERLDRAKILYNHVFHAAELPDEARRALVEDNGYRRIVDHRLFNPRLIEAITSGYGPDEVTAGTDFVDYAVAVLDDPEVLWRRVYENQLEEPERALTRSLVTMPPEAQLDDLERAYASLAGRLGLSSDRFAFRGALGVLDDSLLATELTWGEHLVKFVNPSVEDFIRGRLVASPTALADAIAAAVFFGQLRRIDSLLPAEGAEQGVRLALAERGMELFESDSPTWTRVQGPTGRRSMERLPRELEQRLVFLLRLSGKHDPEFEVVRCFAAERLELLTAEWRQGIGSDSGAVRLVEFLLSDDSPLEPPDTLVEDLKELLTRTADVPEDYRRLLSVRELAPETFSDDDMEEICEKFRDQAINDLQYNTHIFNSLEEIDLYAIVAEELGIEIDPEIVEEAREELGMALDHQTDMEMERMRGDGGRANWASEQSEMDALFSRLVE